VSVALLPRLPSSEVIVGGVGARTATGSTALQVAMTVRAGRFRPRESHLVDRNGQPMVTCRVPAIPDVVYGLERLVALGAPPLALAAQAWMTQAEATRNTAPIPLICALPPEDRPGFDRRLIRNFLPAMAEASGVPIDPTRSRLVLHGRGGGAEAFLLALDRLRAGADAAILVGGVDSFHDPDALEELDRALRLHSPECENGFVPGEGAGFVLLTHRSRATGLPRSAQIFGAALEQEPRPFGANKPTHGLGMTAALRKASAPLGTGARRIGWVMNDVVGERHRIDEWTMARTRAFQVFQPEYVHEEPLAVTGDLGAASAAVLLVTACVRFEVGAAPSDCLAIAVHSDGAERGVVVAGEDRAR